MPETEMWSDSEMSKAHKTEASRELAGYDKRWNDRMPPFDYVCILTFKIVMASILVSIGVSAVGAILVLALKSIFGKI
jgi:hypothetical protein